MRRHVTVAITIAAVTTATLNLTTPVNAQTHQEARAQLCDAAPAHGFADVTGIHATNVGCLVAFGVGYGTSATTFDPHSPLRREHLATLLTNFLALATGTTFEPPTTSPFTDVSQSVHADNIAIAATHNLTQGVTPTRFAPQRLVTRDQYASLLVNTLTAAGHPLPPPTANPFHDLAGNVHAANVARLTAAGIVAGATPQRFDPKAPVTRQQTATLLLNAAAELHLADRWNAGPLEQPADTPADIPADIPVNTGNPQATVSLSQVALNGVQLLTDTTNTAANDPLIITGTANASESTIVNVQGRIDGGAWVSASATSGAFSTAEESFRVVLQDVPDGSRELTVRAIDADGLSSTLTTFTLAVTKPAAAALVSAVTDPAQNRIMLTFDQNVSCADTSNARASWQFQNSSQHAPVAGQASGAPDSINLLPDDPTACALNYTTSGIRVSDYGTVSYTRPDPDHAVRTDTGQLAQTVDANVVDGFAPSLVSINIDSGTDSKVIAATFSEPMQCWTFDQDDFWIAVSGVTNAFTIASMSCSVTSTTITLTMTDFEFVSGMQVNFAIVADVFDASADNKAPAPVTATTVVL